MRSAVSRSKLLEPDPSTSLSLVFHNTALIGFPRERYQSHRVAAKATSLKFDIIAHARQRAA